MAISSIEYDEGSFEPNLGYKSVTFSFNGLKENRVFDSGNFVKDWYDHNKFIITDWKGDEPTMNSSSVDHFIMDGAKFDNAWLTFQDEKPLLVYEYCECIEFFVAEGTQPTWEELQKIVKDENIR